MSLEQISRVNLFEQKKSRNQKFEMKLIVKLLSFMANFISFFAALVGAFWTSRSII